MKTLFVSGSDTNVGKTWVVGMIAQFLAKRGDSVQIVKPIETGASEGSAIDVSDILKYCNTPNVTGFTLKSFRLPISPVAAAKKGGVALYFPAIQSSIVSLPSNTDWRIVEGAGSLATPICVEGKDWSDLAKSLEANRVVLVVENRVGAIGQARLVYEYAKGKGLNCGIWLNEIHSQDSVVRESTWEGIESLGIPIWNSSHPDKREIDSLELKWL